MKRLIAGLVCALMLSATACAQKYQNVSQLRERDVYKRQLRRSAPMAATYGEGEPTGDFNYTWVEAVSYTHLWQTRC